MIKNQLKHDFYYHLSLIGILAGGFILAVLFRFDKTKELVIVCFTTVLYIFRALLHHYSAHTLSAKIVVEYIAIGSLGISLLALVLQRVSF